MASFISGGGGGKSIFMATYGVTTYAEIQAAYNAGKIIVVLRELNGTTLYILTDVGSSGTYHFRSFSSTSNINYGCYITSDGVWNVNSNTFASVSSPSFTGTPTAPTAASGTNTTQIATTAFVQTGLDTKQKIITVSTEEPTSSDGTNGDIWFVYEE